MDPLKTQRGVRVTLKIRSHSQPRTNSARKWGGAGWALHFWVFKRFFRIVLENMKFGCENFKDPPNADPWSSYSCQYCPWVGWWWWGSNPGVLPFTAPISAGHKPLFSLWGGAGLPAPCVAQLQQGKALLYLIICQRMNFLGWTECRLFPKLHIFTAFKKKCDIFLSANKIKK